MAYHCRWTGITGLCGVKPYVHRGAVQHKLHVSLWVMLDRRMRVIAFSKVRRYDGNDDNFF